MMPSLNDITDIEKLMEELKLSVDTRDQMGGNLYWSVCNEYCCRVASQIIKLAVSKPNFIQTKEEIEKILGKGNFTIS